MRNSRGLTLIEIMIALAVIATLTGIAVGVYGNVTERSKVAKAIADLQIMDGEIAAFEGEHGRLPTGLAEIGHGSLRDPWGNPYDYLAFDPSNTGVRRKDRNLVPINSTYDLYSRGRDGATTAPLTAATSQDDVVRANDGGFYGLASTY
ncbi:MAG TPA: prepilin-type N-terminal cleavage/methylation domain-containing protein [Methylomirabilota bacterium]|nr:prepilin-type N-terminal cleavage/methylation domain-containing protein [Methylomirabilota bacterium]